jgi:hypothetical protein
MSSKTTHVRIEKSILEQDRQMHPNMSFNEVHKMYRDMYEGIQKAGKFLYGNAWKKK